MHANSGLKAAVVGILVLIAVVVGVGVYVNVEIVNSVAFKESLNTARSSPTLQNKLGDGIHASYPVLGHFVPFGNSKFMEWSVRLTGSRGHGRLYAVANEINGVWDFSRLTFESNDERNSLDLTPVRAPSVPKVPKKHVYLVPLDLGESESLTWAPSYYKSEFDIDVSVLPAISSEPSIIDRKRDQIIAENCIDFLRRNYPQFARDPASIVVALSSRDMYIRSFGWRYAENLRSEGRFAVISTARLHPPVLMDRLNHEWLTSRIQKLLTKNLAILYFDLPMSSDYTSLLSGGVLSGVEIDEIGNRIVGAEGQWHPFEAAAPSITIFDVPGKEPIWNRTFARWPLPDTTAQVFSADLSIGLFVQRKADFIFEDEPALQFSRSYRSQDARSRAFGIGASHSFDLYIVGQMGVAVDLVFEDGSRIHYVHQRPVAGQRGDIYGVTGKTDERFFQSQAIFLGDHWEIKTEDGWTYFFPYQPHALPQNVTVLTSFIDPAGRKYQMDRDSFGLLLSVASPAGKWLHFENDAEHRIREITSSSGRTIRYEYDAGGRLTRVTASDGHVESYTYDEKGEMLTASHGDDKPLLVNEYFNDGYLKKQRMVDGRSFSYSYFREVNRLRENYIVDPNGLETYIQWGPEGAMESLPQLPPPGRNPAE